MEKIKPRNSIIVVIIARNEENYLPKTLTSLLKQDLEPYRIIVVDDGSTDKTREFALKFDKVEVVSLKNKKTNLQAKKELSNTFNAGFEKLDEDNNWNYVLILGADTVLPNNYFSEIVKIMKEDSKIAISAGIIKGEFSKVPRGSGRVVKREFFEKVGLRYPVNYGFEGYLLLKAQSLGYKIKVQPNLKMETTRETFSSLNPKKYYFYGLGKKSLGYTFPYVIFEFFSLFRKKPLAAFHLLNGYFSDYDQLYEPELRNFVKESQNKKIKNFFRR